MLDGVGVLDGLDVGVLVGVGVIVRDKLAVLVVVRDGVGEFVTVGV